MRATAWWRAWAGVGGVSAVALWSVACGLTLDAYEDDLTQGTGSSGEPSSSSGEPLPGDPSSSSSSNGGQSGASSGDPASSSSSGSSSGDPTSSSSSGSSSGDPTSSSSGGSSSGGSSSGAVPTVCAGGVLVPGVTPAAERPLMWFYGGMGAPARYVPPKLTECRVEGSSANEVPWLRHALWQVGGGESWELKVDLWRGRGWVGVVFAPQAPQVNDHALSTDWAGLPVLTWNVGEPGSKPRWSTGAPASMPTPPSSPLSERNSTLTIVAEDGRWRVSARRGDADVALSAAEAEFVPHLDARSFRPYLVGESYGCNGSLPIERLGITRAELSCD